MWEGGRPLTDSSFQRRSFVFFLSPIGCFPSYPDHPHAKAESQQRELKVDRRLFYKPLTSGDT